MAIRTLVLFSFGAPFGGFRLAIGPRAVGGRDSATFGALERAVHNLRSVLAAHPPDRWAQLAQSEVAIGDAAKLFEGRSGFVDFQCDPRSTTGDVVVRAWCPFRLWPLGGRAVYDAWHREADGTWVPFGEEELAALW